MTGIGTVIPYVMTALLTVGLAGALFVRRWAWWVAAAIAALFLLSLRFPDPKEAAEAAELHLHWFPATLLILILATVGMPIAALTGWILRTIYRQVRRSP